MTTKLIHALHRALGAQLSSYGWRGAPRCLLSMALGMWIAEGKKGLAALTYLVSEGALSRFFNGERWPAEQIQKLRGQMSEELLHSWYGGRGRPPIIYLILDGTVLPKRGKQLPKLGWHYDSRVDGLRWGQKIRATGGGTGPPLGLESVECMSTRIAAKRRTSRNRPSRQ